MAHWREHIRPSYVGPGVVAVDIDTRAYPMVGDHWREQLTGKNARRWGRIFIDPCAEEKAVRRKLALAPFHRLYEGEPGNNNDECPGAMFVWEKNETAHVQPCNAFANQQFGRDLYWALRFAITHAPQTARAGNAHRRMGWWEVKFSFHRGGP